MKNVKFIGNFNSKLLAESLVAEKTNKKLIASLNLFHSICKIMQESKVIFYF